MGEKRKENAAVISQEKLAEGIYSMWIRTEASKSAKPGQFISVYTNDGSKLLPRPISICEIDKEEGKLRIVYRVTGRNTGTEQFSRLDEGKRNRGIVRNADRRKPRDCRAFGQRVSTEREEGVFDRRRNRRASDPGACEADGL